MNTIKKESILKCPHCGYEELHTMPENDCIHFHLCHNCLKIIKPKEDDCCIYCSYGSEKCPPQQMIELELRS